MEREWVFKTVKEKEDEDGNLRKFKFDFIISSTFQ